MPSLLRSSMSLQAFETAYQTCRTRSFDLHPRILAATLASLSPADRARIAGDAQNAQGLGPLISHSNFTPDSAAHRVLQRFASTKDEHWPEMAIRSAVGQLFDDELEALREALV